MICQRCGGRVEWKGPLTNLTHTECLECGGKNCQEPEPDEFEEADDRENDVVIGFECGACGHVQESDGWGGECDKCCAKALNEIYY